MFNLLVSASAWESGRISYGQDRMFDGTDHDIEQKYSKDGAPLFAKLIELPTLFAEETNRWASVPQFARVGRIVNAHQSGREIVVNYLLDPTVPPVPQSALIEMAPKLGIQLKRRSFGELETSHWAVKRADLFQTLYTESRHPARSPKVFSVGDLQVIDQKLLSVMMPFAGFDAVYAAIQRAATTVGMQLKRADNIWEHTFVIQDIVSLIDNAAVVVCDCSGRNANVFYEIGIAHSLGKEVILITQNKADIPFDLAHHRYIHYLNNGEGLQALELALASRLTTLLSTA